MHKKRRRNDAAIAGNANKTEVEKTEPRTREKDGSSVFLMTNLVSPRPRQICKPLLIWAEALRKELRDLYDNKLTRLWIEKAVDVLNQAVRIFILSGQNKRARDLCYTQIHLFLAWSGKTRQTDLLKHLFQPWIHLITLDRHEGRFYDAIEKSNVFIRHEDHHGCMRENSLLKNLMDAALRQDKVLFDTVILQATLERIKLYFHLKQYRELINYLDHFPVPVTGMHQCFIPEARFIAYVNVCDTRRAVNLLGCEAMKYPSSVDPILKLRECELRLTAGVDRKVLSDIQHLYHLAWRRVTMENTRFCHMDFALHTASIMGMAGRLEDAVRLAEYCHVLAVQAEDEPLQAESLIQLYQLIQDRERKQKIEDLMIIHYFNTRYAISREKMLSCYQDLKFVEHQYHHDELTSLFEDCLSAEYWHGHV